VVARTADTPVAAFERPDAGFAGVQFHPEVLHTEHGQAVLEHFLYEIAGCRPTWTMGNVIDEQVERIREQIGDAG
jgi:GMP synthase (glutamine-hydrolysing)